MPKIYKHLTTQERAVVMTMRADQCSIRSIAKCSGSHFKPTVLAFDADLGSN